MKLATGIAPWRKITRKQMPKAGEMVAFPLHRANARRWVFAQVNSGNVAYRKTASSWLPYTHVAPLTGPDGRGGYG